MKKSFFIVLCMCVGLVNADAQFLNRLVRAAGNAAENAVQRNVEKKIEEGVDQAFDGEQNEKSNDNESSKQKSNKSKDSNSSGWTCPSCGTSGNTGKFCSECGAKQPEPSDGTWTCPSCGTKGNTGKFCNECGAKRPDGNSAASAQPKKVETAYSKCDFVPGDEVIFDDDFANEQLGEFSSKWDLLGGNSEVVKHDGRMAVGFESSSTEIAPLMKDPKNYLTSEFTIEFDFFAGDNSTIGENLYSRSDYTLIFYDLEGYKVLEYAITAGDDTKTYWYYTSITDNGISSSFETDKLLRPNEWNHFSLSFNKRALKAYVNGTRVTNIPNMKAPAYMAISSRSWQDHGADYMTNFRIAKGAVPLYDRLTTDGKIITYAITFETGKAELKPESQVEIMRITKLMQDDASLNFEVQGHCDNTGNDKVNDALSQKRAEAIVAALVEQGIAASRLTAVGKGSHSPIADNSTDEGRAKNRRVEFVKK
ncbi:MAG: OmpA family protein [Paludibacteraceae bacterium]|nr:OmpA family protein [Paludibacteraceae bacterium]